MAAIDLTLVQEQVDYPTADGKPMAESEWHLWNTIWLVQVLSRWFADDPLTYVGGDMLMYYEEGNPRRHVAPDVFIVQGIPTDRQRGNYLVWQEGKGPDVVFELTSRSTRREDELTKYELYRDVLGVREYFLFDPRADYLVPPTKGYRLVAGRYEPIEPVAGRFPSEVLGLHVDRDDWILRLFNPDTDQWLPLPEEAVSDAQEQAAQAQARADQAEAELARLRRELEALRQRSPEQD